MLKPCVKQMQTAANCLWGQWIGSSFSAIPFLEGVNSKHIYKYLEYKRIVFGESRSGTRIASYCRSFWQKGTAWLYLNMIFVHWMSGNTLSTDILIHCTYNLLFIFIIQFPLPFPLRWREFVLIKKVICVETLGTLCSMVCRLRGLDGPC